MKTVLKIYNRYEHLAHNYARQFQNVELYAIEREDLLQEFRMKIWLSIISYGKAWKRYRTTGRLKPVPIAFYIKAALVNKRTDIMKKCIKANTHLSVSLDESIHDFGRYSTFSSSVDFKKKEIVINEVNLLEGLNEVQKGIFCMYMKGNPPRLIMKVFGKELTRTTIKMQVSKLEKVKHKLYDGILYEFLPSAKMEQVGID